ncbi:hypothetical protein [Hamadaea tsunoensis]|uniref:hypothetical protein n=1 Tax=Hamadaea tsunoensis TaxID=53368 RepID=UPI0004859AA0|nr:hypothetical protein [Hamadaea tsunoensis]
MTADETDWARLFHARGPATDLPAKLAALCGADQEAASEALTFLWPRIFGGGRLTPATAPAVRYLVAILDDPTFGAGDDGILDGVLFLLREIARVTTGADIEKLRDRVDINDAVAVWLDDYLAQPEPPEVHGWSDTDDPGRVLLDQALIDCFDLLPEAVAAVWPIPIDWPRWTRVMAACAASMLVRHPQLANLRGEVIAFHEEAARSTADRRECASYLIGLGELGVAPRAWLDDPRLAVRTCAALAPALAADDAAIDLLVRAAEHPRAFDHSFAEPFVAPAYRMMVPAQFQGWPYRVLIRTVCERVGDFPRLLSAALAAIDLRGVYRPVPEFGPYLRLAFPAGLVEDGTASAEQSCFARAVAERDELWDGTFHGVAEMLTAAGLPHDRERWRNVRTPEGIDDEGRPTYASVNVPRVEPVRTMRKFPQMFLGAARTDPDLLRKLLNLCHATDASVEIEGPLCFTVTAKGVDSPQPDAEDLIGLSLLRSPELYAMSVAAAFSLWISVRQWIDGVAYRQQFVDGVPMSPRETLGPADREDGYHIAFELDAEWLPPGARLPG